MVKYLVHQEKFKEYLNKFEVLRLSFPEKDLSTFLLDKYKVCIIQNCEEFQFLEYHQNNSKRMKYFVAATWLFLRFYYCCPDFTIFESKTFM
jgi:hypothetical protein